MVIFVTEGVGNKDGARIAMAGWLCVRWFFSVSTLLSCPECRAGDGADDCSLKSKKEGSEDGYVVGFVDERERTFLLLFASRSDFPFSNRMITNAPIANSPSEKAVNAATPMHKRLEGLCSLDVDEFMGCTFMVLLIISSASQNKVWNGFSTIVKIVTSAGMLHM
jgi:hypothetical protein